MNYSEERLLTIMGALKKGTADPVIQRQAYNMIQYLARKFKKVNAMVDEMLKDQYVKKVKHG
jgi:hypothetical protein